MADAKKTVPVMLSSDNEHGAQCLLGVLHDDYFCLEPWHNMSGYVSGYLLTLHKAKHGSQIDFIEDRIRAGKKVYIEVKGGYKGRLIANPDPIDDCASEWRYFFEVCGLSSNDPFPPQFKTAFL